MEALYCWGHSKILLNKITKLWAECHEQMNSFFEQGNELFNWKNDTNSGPLQHLLATWLYGSVTN